MAAPRTPDWRSPARPILIGVSACLLGEAVRYDGGHKRDEYLASVLAPHVTWVPVCPEVEIGLGIPREPIRLVGDPKRPRLVGAASGDDHTRAMTAYARRRVEGLAQRGLSGYVLKRGSPSCGMERVRVFTEAGAPGSHGRGLFAAALAEGLPLLPVEEEGRLDDPAVRESFLARVFTFHRWAALRDAAPRAGDVDAFHAAHKLLLLAHSVPHCRRLGRLVAGMRGRPGAAWLDEYGARLMEALAVRATRRKHVNALQHAAARVTDRLDDVGRRELLALIEDFRQGLVPLVVPITLINHHVARLGVSCVRDQVYLRPHPKELVLRNHV